jgi:transcriptional regulator with XRE-family HTH domain
MASILLDTVSTMKDEAAVVAPHDINARIASRVRTLRTDLGMTLDGLAAKCPRERSMISLVERGESSPTAVVLEKIASGLGGAARNAVRRFGRAGQPCLRPDDRVPWRDPQSGYVRRNISPANYPSPIHDRRDRVARRR